MNQNGAFTVKTSNLSGSGVEFIAYQGIERHKLPVRTFNEHKFEHIDFAAKINVRLHDNFISSAESVVIIDLHTAEIDLQRAVNVSEIYAEHFNLFLVEFILITGRSYAESSIYALKFGAFVSGLNNFICYVGKFVIRVAF